MITNYANLLEPAKNWYNGKESGRVLGWFSGGVASFLTCLYGIEEYGDDCEIWFLDTNQECEDSFRLMDDFEKLTGFKVNIARSERFKNPEHVWLYYNGLNYAHGAPCSMSLKQEVRKKVEDLDNDYCQLFGFDFRKKEMKRAINMVKNHPELNPKFPLIEREIDRNECFIEFKRLGIDPPKAYKNFENNNCIGKSEDPRGGCVQGSIGYWQHLREIYPHKFERMAQIEHYISEQKGKAVTICKDQRKETKGDRLFLKHNPRMPEVGVIDLIKGRKPVSMAECNGFCGTMDLF